MVYERGERFLRFEVKMLVREGKGWRCLNRDVGHERCVIPQLAKNRSNFI